MANLPATNRMHRKACTFASVLAFALATPAPAEPPPKASAALAARVAAGRPADAHAVFVFFRDKGEPGGLASRFTAGARAPGSARAEHR